MNNDKSQYEEQLPDRPDFISELRDLINKHSIENNSNTPDFILAQYLTQCLRAWNMAVTHRDKWYGSAKKEATEPVQGGMHEHLKGEN